MREVFFLFSLLFVRVGGVLGAFWTVFCLSCALFFWFGWKRVRQVNDRFTVKSAYKKQTGSIFFHNVNFLLWKNSVVWVLATSFGVVCVLHCKGLCTFLSLGYLTCFQKLRGSFLRKTSKWGPKCADFHLAFSVSAKPWGRLGTFFIFFLQPLVQNLQHYVEVTRWRILFV